MPQNVRPKSKNSICGSNLNSKGTYSTCNLPLFVVSKPQNCPTRWCQRVACTTHRGGQGWVNYCPLGEKMVFFFNKNIFLDHLGPKQVFTTPFMPVVTRFGLWKVPKCLENGSVWGRKWVSNVFFQTWLWTILRAQTREMYPFSARFDPFWHLQGPQQP